MRAVSSMRVPVLARRCSLNWPVSDDGKEVLAQPGKQQKSAQADQQKDRYEDDPAR